MLGGYDENFALMIFGRIIFGIGCENMYVGQSAIVAEWFINYELPLSISLISSIPLIGSFLNGAITPRDNEFESYVESVKMVTPSKSERKRNFHPNSTRNKDTKSL